MVFMFNVTMILRGYQQLSTSLRTSSKDIYIPSHIPTIHMGPACKTKLRKKQNAQAIKNTTFKG